MDLARLAVWLAETPGSIALRESLYLYPLTETVHVIGIACFVGTISMVDLRLLGLAFQQVSISQMTSRILPWTVAGFAAMTMTGLLLFYAIPVRTYHSLWFRIKVALIILAAVNIWLFHWRVERDREKWDSDAKPPLSVRVSAAVSLAAWAGVIVMGRMIAYNWFDCDRAQSSWLAWIDDCNSGGL